MLPSGHPPLLCMCRCTILIPRSTASPRLLSTLYLASYSAVAAAAAAHRLLPPTPPPLPSSISPCRPSSDGPLATRGLPVSSRPCRLIPMSCMPCGEGNLVGTRDRPLSSPCVAALTTCIFTHCLRVRVRVRGTISCSHQHQLRYLCLLSPSIPRHLCMVARMTAAVPYSHSHHLLCCMTSLRLHLFPRASPSARSANLPNKPYCRLTPAVPNTLPLAESTTPHTPHN
jgi:hypothetical protein